MTAQEVFDLRCAIKSKLEFLRDRINEGLTNEYLTKADIWYSAKSANLPTEEECEAMKFQNEKLNEFILMLGPREY